MSRHKTWKLRWNYVPISKGTNIRRHLNRNTVTAMISIDCSKAFDTVWQGHLCRQLVEYKCPEQLYTTIVFLSERDFRRQSAALMCCVDTIFTVYADNILIHSNSLNAQRALNLTGVQWLRYCFLQDRKEEDAVLPKSWRPHHPSTKIALGVTLDKH